MPDELRCAACGGWVEPGASFCGTCGVEQQPSAPEAAAATSASPEVDGPATARGARPTILIVVALAAGVIAAVGVYIVGSGTSDMSGLPIGEAGPDAASRDVVPLPLDTTSPPAGDGLPIERAAPGVVTLAVPAVMLASEREAITAVVAGFEATTAHEIVLIEFDEDEPTAVTGRALDDRPDVAFHENFQTLMALARRGEARPLRDDVVAVATRAPYPSGLAAAASVDGQAYTVPIGLTVKSLVWYPRALFDRHGYAVPNTWAKLLDLSARLEEDGHTPWCIGIASGDATGWVITDWLEDLMLRFHGPEVYDHWATNRVRFNSPEFRAAVAAMASIWFREGWGGGRSGIVETSFLDAIHAFAPPDQDCLLHRQAAFVADVLPDQVRLGSDVDVFALPGLDSGGAPLIVSAHVPAVYTDNPRAFEFLHYLTTRQAHELWAANADSVPGRLDAVMDDAGHLQQRQAEMLGRAPTVRFDASDHLMPPEIGLAAFWNVMTQFVAGQISIDEAVQRLDAAWP